MKWKMGHVHLINNFSFGRKMQNAKKTAMFDGQRNWRVKPITAYFMCVYFWHWDKRARAHTRAFDERMNGQMMCSERNKSENEHRQQQTDETMVNSNNTTRTRLHNVKRPQVKLIMRVLITCFNFYLLELVEHTYIIIMMIIKRKMWKINMERTVNE